MENASKALLLASGFLMAILLISLLTYAWGKLSKYQSSNDEIKNIENIAKFNEQFTQYNRDDVKGYEIITLHNMVIDYNQRFTNDSNINTNKYSKIELTIDMGNTAERKKLTYDDVLRLFNKTTYVAADSSGANRGNSFYQLILSEIETVRSVMVDINGNPLDDARSTKLAKNIGSIFLSQGEITRRAANTASYNGNEDMVYQDMVNHYNQCIGSSENINFAKNNLVLGGIGSGVAQYYNYACECYEFMQFKKSKFNCTGVTYNDTTGRVEKMNFEFGGVV